MQKDAISSEKVDAEEGKVAVGPEQDGAELMAQKRSSRAEQSRHVLEKVGDEAEKFAVGPEKGVPEAKVQKRSTIQCRARKVAVVP